MRSITIICDTCGREGHIEGFVSSNTWYEPGEVVVSDKEDFSECCCCIQDGGEYEVIDYNPPTFDDDVI